jgi:hypothetical protein
VLRTRSLAVPGGEKLASRRQDARLIYKPKAANRPFKSVANDDGLFKALAMAQSRFPNKLPAPGWAVIFNTIVFVSITKPSRFK